MRYFWIVAFLAACSGGGEQKTDNTAEAKSMKGVNLADMDTTADPKADFFQYASGTWVKNNPVPSTEGKWTAFNRSKLYTNHPY